MLTLLKTGVHWSSAHYLSAPADYATSPDDSTYPAFFFAGTYVLTCFCGRELKFGLSSVQLCGCDTQKRT